MNALRSISIIPFFIVILILALTLESCSKTDIQAEVKGDLTTKTLALTEVNCTGPRLVDGVFGKAYYFDGNGDYINIKHSRSLDINGNEITISAWINAKVIDKRQVIVAKTAWGDNTWLVEINPIDWDDGKLNFYLNAGDTDSNFGSRNAIIPNRWHHVAFVYNGKEKIIYINGGYDASEHDSGKIPTNYQPVRIASWGNPIGPAETRYFEGLIDEVSIFKRALSAAEIQQLYHKQHNFKDTEIGLVGYWTFDDDDGNLIIDSSPYCNNGQTCKEIGPYPTRYHYPVQ